MPVWESKEKLSQSRTKTRSFIEVFKQREPWADSVDIGGYARMATQIFGRNHAIPRRRASETAKENENLESPVGAMRGLFFALLFNALLALAGIAVWQLWELLR